MHPEIEKLIDLALANGQVTEKERNVILKKAAELGVDADEVEMTLDGRLYQLDASKPKEKEKVGNIKICPACGAPVKAMELVCVCSHEFNNTKANSTMQNLELKIEHERSEYIKKNGGIGHTWVYKDFNTKVLPAIVKNFPIPNTKDDLIEALSFMSSKVISSTDTEVNEETNAYQAKALEIITKLHFIPNIDSHLLEFAKEIEIKMKKIKSKAARNSWINSILAIAGVYITYSFIARLFGYHFWPF